MPLVLHTFLDGDFTLKDETLEAMLTAIDRTYKERREFGLAFCVKPGEREAMPSTLCEGTWCSVEEPECPPGTERIGDFHTHAEAYGDPSLEDYLMLLGYAVKGGTGIGCIWGRENNSFRCIAPKEKPTLGKYIKFREIYDRNKSFLEEWELTGREPINGRRRELAGLERETSAYFETIYRCDRAALAEAKGRPTKLTLEECLTFYSHTQLARRAREAGLSAEGGKRAICERLMRAGIL